MTNDEVHDALNKWLKGLTGLTFIQDRPGAEPPPLPYGMTSLSVISELSYHPSRVDYEETDTLNSEGFPEISATPLVELELTFLVFCYGDTCRDVLRKVKMATHLTQIMEPMWPELVIHEVGNVNYIPELVNERWEPRAQVNISVRGISSDSFVIDVIESTEPYTIQATTQEP